MTVGSRPLWRLTTIWYSFSCAQGLPCLSGGRRSSSRSWRYSLSCPQELACARPTSSRISSSTFLISSKAAVGGDRAIGRESGPEIVHQIGDEGEPDGMASGDALDGNRDGQMRLPGARLAEEGEPSVGVGREVPGRLEGAFQGCPLLRRGVVAAHVEALEGHAPGHRGVYAALPGDGLALVGADRNDGRELRRLQPAGGRRGLSRPGSTRW